MLANKDSAGFFEALKGPAPMSSPSPSTARPPSPRRWRRWRAAMAWVRTVEQALRRSVEAALDRALRLGAGRVVICGSLYLAGRSDELPPARRRVRSAHI
jgi:dihydrofolate synthase/folylpolyglutamate synthase